MCVFYIYIYIYSHLFKHSAVFLSDSIHSLWFIHVHHQHTAKGKQRSREIIGQGFFLCEFCLEF